MSITSSQVLRLVWALSQQPELPVAAGVANPWAEGSINLTKQMALEVTDPDLAAVLKREAGK